MRWPVHPYQGSRLPSHRLTPRTHRLIPHTHRLTPHAHGLTPHTHGLSPHSHGLTRCTHTGLNPPHTGRPIARAGFLSKSPCSTLAWKICLAAWLQPLLMPEDDKSWSMLESSYSTIEFDYVPNSTQVSGRKARTGAAAPSHSIIVVCLMLYPTAATRGGACRNTAGGQVAMHRAALGV